MTFPDDVVESAARGAGAVALVSGGAACVVPVVAVVGGAACVVSVVAVVGVAVLSVGSAGAVAG